MPSDREAVERAITFPKVTKDIGELLSEAHSKEKRDNRECLLKILSSVKCKIPSVPGSCIALRCSLVPRPYFYIKVTGRKI